MIGGIGPTELIIVLDVALVLLGPKRLPEAGRSLGRGLRGFRETLSGGDPEPETPAAAPATASRDRA